MFQHPHFAFVVAVSTLSCQNAALISYLEICDLMKDSI